MEDPMSPRPNVTPAPTPEPTPTIPKGMVRIVIPDGKTLLKIKVKKYPVNTESPYVSEIFTGPKKTVMLLDWYIDPTSGESTVVYGLFES